MPHLARVIAAEARTLPAGQLYLRIACRTAAWKQATVGTLKDVWGQGVQVLDLLPLREVDIRLAAESENLDARAFFDEVARAGAAGLAMMPVTLRFLLESYRERGALPASRFELYESGLLRLCQEAEERVQIPRQPELSATHRLRVAERIAASTLFAGSQAVVTPYLERPPADAVRLVDLEGGTEAEDDDVVAASEGALMQTLNTGLFTGRAPHVFGFTHHTYAEFLAARFLLRRRCPIPQIRSLIGVPNADPFQVAPQLRGVAAWLASRNRDFLALLVDTQPEVLLRADLPGTGVGDPAAVTTALLDRVDAGLVLAPFRDDRRALASLSHPNLGAQLAGWIGERHRRAETRNLAIKIVEACQCRELAPALAATALDAGEDYSVRRNAAHAVVDIGDDAARRSLIPLLAASAEDDPDDDLKGLALQGLWPGLIPLEDLLGALSPPKRDDYFGAYSIVLYSPRVVDALDLDGLATAVSWVADLAPEAIPDRTFRSLPGRLVRRALHEVTGDPRLLEPLVRLAMHRLEQRRPLYERELLDGDEYDPLGIPAARRALLAVIVPRVADPVRPYDLVHAGLAAPEDFAWLVDEATQLPEGERGSWGAVAAAVFDPHSATSRERLAALDRADATAREWLDVPRAAPPPRAPEAAAARPFLGDPPQRTAEDAAALERSVVQQLDKVAGGDLDGWVWSAEAICRFGQDRWHICRDLTATDGWPLLAEALHRRLAEAARTFLLRSAPEDGEVVRVMQDGALTYRVIAGYRALALLHREDHQVLRELPRGQWAAWVPALLGIFGFEGQEQLAIQKDLASVAYAAAPEEFSAAVARLMLRAHGCPFEVIAHVWDEALQRVMLQQVAEAALPAESIEAALTALVRAGAPRAREVAETLVGGPGARAASVAAASALLATAADCGWGVIGPRLSAQPDWGREVLVAASRVGDEVASRLAAALSDADLGALVHWLFVQYPPAQDPRGVFVGPGIHMLRDPLLTVLQERGTVTAVDSLRVLERALPQYRWLRRVVLKAEMSAAERSWHPVSPKDLLALARDPGKRRVASGQHLFELVMESLERLVADLHGDLASVRFLWECAGLGSPRPREEEDLSDWVARHLRTDLRDVVVSREVQIRRKTHHGGAPGQRTDVRVDAIPTAPAEGDVVTLFLEVKGSWNRDLVTALEAQLVDRYLRDNQCRHGVYLVGWFMCDAWSRDDGRRAHAGYDSLASCEAALSEQAVIASRAHGVTVKARVIDCRLP
jgi:hypothetical protein